MRVLVEGSGGSAGWPQPGCRCASCLRQEADGNIRRESTIVIDGRVRLGIEDAEGGDAGGGDAGGGDAEGGDAGEREGGGEGRETRRAGTRATETRRAGTRAAGTREAAQPVIR